MKRFSIPFLGMGLALVLAGTGLAFNSGCETDRSSRVTRYQEPDLSLHATTRKVYAGEVVTITTETANLLGHDAEVKWSTTGGELNTQDQNRVARVQFDAPGTYVVSAQLWADGELVKTDSVTVTVLPLR